MQNGQHANPEFGGGVIPARSWRWILQTEGEVLSKTSGRSHREERPGILLWLFLVLARLLALHHGSSSRRRRMGTEAASTFLSFFLAAA